jgi:hypothetical protein
MSHKAVPDKMEEARSVVGIMDPLVAPVYQGAMVRDQRKPRYTLYTRNALRYRQ